MNNKIEGLAYQRANSKDRDLLFRWANDTIARKNSFSDKMITLDDHIHWFNNKINDPDCVLLIFKIHAVPVGLIRIEKTPASHNEATISINIDKSFRGKGLGSEMLRSGVEYYWQNNNNNILAFIKTDNISSIKTFLKAGFIRIGTTIINDIDSLIFKIEKNAYRSP